MNREQFETAFVYGISSPYDGVWNAEAHDFQSRNVPLTPARCAALAVISDLRDRGGIKRGFEEIEEEICAEIVDTLTGIIEAAGDPAFLAHVVATAEAKAKADAELWAKCRA